MFSIRQMNGSPIRKIHYGGWDIMVRNVNLHYQMDGIQVVLDVILGLLHIIVIQIPGLRHPIVLTLLAELMILLLFLKNYAVMGK